MRTIAIAAALFAIALPASANDDAELAQLIARVQQASSSPGYGADKRAAIQALRQAAAALEGQGQGQGRGSHHRPYAGRRRGGHHHQDSCLQLGVQAYGSVYTQTTAFEKAMRKCSGDVDGELVAVAYDAYRSVFTDVSSFEKAAELASSPALFGKARAVRRAYVALQQTLPQISAIERAGEKVAPLPYERVGCFEQALSMYSRNLYAQSAIEKAVRTCSQ